MMREVSTKPKWIRRKFWGTVAQVLSVDSKSRLISPDRLRQEFVFELQCPVMP
jgi:DNA-binding transcriptional regulator/RsmH inhibitor MraZ